MRSSRSISSNGLGPTLLLWFAGGQHEMAEGEITPDEAAVAASVIETKRKALETEELDRRVAVLEQQLSKRK